MREEKATSRAVNSRQQASPLISLTNPEEKSNRKTNTAAATTRSAKDPPQHNGAEYSVAPRAGQENPY